MGFNSAFKGLIFPSNCYSWLLGEYIEGDQKVSMHLMITIHSSGAQELFDHPVHNDAEKRE